MPDTVTIPGQAQLGFPTIADAARRIAARELSPVELTQALLDRIAAVGPQIDAFITLTAESALADARRAEAEITAGNHKGPLHGIPLGLKDIFDVAGVPTTGHSETARGNVPAADAATTARLRAAGAVLMGKLSTHEFAHGGPSFDLPWPPARNPWAREHFSGGSSSGSGAAVAAGLVLGALGSDTGGSIRTPASLCGIAGLKPTYGLVSRRGVIPNSFTFDHAGPMAWTAEDCAILLQAIAGHDPADPASADRPVPDFLAGLNRPIRGLRVGLLRHFWEEDLPANPEVVAGMEAAAQAFRDLGATVETARIASCRDYYDVKITIAESELFSVHHRHLVERPQDFGEDFLARSLPACLYSAVDYVHAQRRRAQLLAEMEPVYARFDLLLAPGTYGPAPRLDAHRSTAFWHKASVTNPFNVTGGPAISVCMGYSASGLPLGLQIAGRPFDDARVLQAAHAYEQATPWRGRRPVLEAGVEPDRTVPPPEEIPPGDPALAALVDGMAARAGLTLNERQRALLHAAAPHTFAMADRLRARTKWHEEPANTFRFR